MKVGFDWGGVLDEHAELLVQLATALKNDGHEVYIVSAINEDEHEIRKQQVEDLMPGVCVETITLVSNHPDQPADKLKIIKDKGIQMFFDDRGDTSELLQRNGVLALQVPKVDYEKNTTS